MGKIEQVFSCKLSSNPKQTVRLIVRVTGDMSQASTRLAELGATMLRSFNLTKAISVSAPAGIALALADEPWVLSIEEDRQITTQP